MSKTILCCDDDEDDRQLLCNGLMQADPTVIVVHAVNGIQALDTLRALHKAHDLPCLMILDINMPMISGKEVVTEIANNELYPTLPIIIFSTSAGSRDTLYFESIGITVMQKPSSAAELKEVIHSMLSFCRVDKVSSS